MTMPDWVPEGIRRAAADFSDSRIVHRLTHDPRMEKIWRQLMAPDKGKRRHHSILGNAISELASEQRCKDEANLADEDKAAAALFLIFMKEMTDCTIVTKRTRNKMMQDFNSIADLCRAQRFLRYPIEIENGLALNHPRRDPLLASSLEITANYFKEIAILLSAAEGSRWGAYEKDEFNQRKCLLRTRVKAQMSAIIIAADKLYTPNLRSALRQIAEIGFKVEVKDKDIDNWRRTSRLST